MFHSVMNYIVGEKSLIGYYDRCLMNKHPINDTNDSEVNLVVRCVSDHNGAFSLARPFQSRELLNNENIKIVYKYVTNINEIDQTITQLKNQGNKIKGLTIQGHGSSGSTALGESTFDGISTNAFRAGKKLGFDTLENAIDKLEKDAVINLDSCSTGYVGINGKTSLAQAITEVAKGRIVIAPRKDAVALLIDRKVDNGILLNSYYNIKKYSNLNFVNEIVGIMFANLYMYTGIDYLRENISVLHKAVPKQKSDAEYNIHNKPIEPQSVKVGDRVEVGNMLVGVVVSIDKNKIIFAQDNGKKSSVLINAITKKLS